MWTNPIVVPLSPLAIHAEDLEAGREVVPFEPAIHLLAGLYAELPFVSSAIILDVVDAQKGRLSLSATRANITAIGLIDLVSDFVSACRIALVGAVTPYHQFDRRHGSHPYGSLAGLLLIGRGLQVCDAFGRKRGSLCLPRIPCVVTAACTAPVVHGILWEVGCAFRNAALAARGVCLEVGPSQVLAQDYLGTGHTES
jgi:hypothetical protein